MVLIARSTNYSGIKRQIFLVLEKKDDWSWLFRRIGVEHLFSAVVICIVANPIDPW